MPYRTDAPGNCSIGREQFLMAPAGRHGGLDASTQMAR